MSVTWSAQQGLDEVVKPTEGKKGLLLWSHGRRLADAVRAEAWDLATKLARGLAPLVPDADKRSRPYSVGTIHYESAPDETRAAVDAYNDAVWALRGVTRPVYTPPAPLSDLGPGVTQSGAARPFKRSHSSNNSTARGRVVRPPELTDDETPAAQVDEAPAAEDEDLDSGEDLGLEDVESPSQGDGVDGGEEIPLARGEACVSGREWLGATITGISGDGRRRYITLSDGRKYVTGKHGTVARRWPWPGCEKEVGRWKGYE